MTRSLSVATLCALALLLVNDLLNAADEPSAPKPAPRQLFLDPDFLEERSGVTLHVNPAERRELVIRPDQPWEKRMISFFLTVLDDGGKLRMWYVCRDADNQPNVAYAESSDGVT